MVFLAVMDFRRLSAGTCACADAVATETTRARITLASRNIRLSLRVSRLVDAGIAGRGRATVSCLAGPLTKAEKSSSGAYEVSRLKWRRCKTCPWLPQASIRAGERNCRKESQHTDGETPAAIAPQGNSVRRIRAVAGDVRSPHGAAESPHAAEAASRRRAAARARRRWRGFSAGAIKGEAVVSRPLVTVLRLASGLCFPVVRTASSSHRRRATSPSEWCAAPEPAGIRGTVK